jgi:hypothetical protein
MVLDPWGVPVPLWEWLYPEKIDVSFRHEYFLDLAKLYRGRYCADPVDTKSNARIKVYKHKLTMQVCNDTIFSTGDWERSDGHAKREYDVPPKGQAADPERSAEESRRRAKSKVRDIALCNQFDYMVTWTLDPAKVDRYDPVAVYKKIRPFLTHMTQRKAFSYVIIPEYHKLKDGEEKPAIHFHGLCSLGDVQIERSKKRGRPRVDKHGRAVFNMTDWSLGWSTVVPLDGDYEKAVNYITKYISKQDEKILGKYYLSSRSLKKSPDIIPIAENVPYDTFRDESKIALGEQYESTVFRDVKIISEDFEK